MAYSIERYHDFCAGHRVHGHESKCAHLHGHNYRVYFRCQPAPTHYHTLGASYIPIVQEEPGELDSLGRVVDFSVVKQLLCNWLENNWDHKFLVWDQDPTSSYLLEIDQTVQLVPFNPTAEHMAEYLVRVVGPSQLIGTGVQLYECVVQETRKCSATYSII